MSKSDMQKQQPQKERVQELAKKFISSKEVINKFTILQWILISIRLTLFVMLLIPHILLQKYILPILYIPLPIVKRYISTVLNLFYLRAMFLTLGFFRFQCQNYRFFQRDSPKILLKSGYIGMGNHKNIIDFMYYSYLLNPVFVRLVLVKKQLQKIKNQQESNKSQYDIYYAPLPYSESLICAMSPRGFDPIIVQDQKQMKKIKYRKMSMKTLVSECFQELRGPIFILLPGIYPNQHLKINNLVAEDIFENQKRFLRSGVGFKISFDQRETFQKIYKNQFYMLLTLMSQLHINHITSTALTFRNYAWKYTKETYSDFIDKNLYVNQSQNNTKLNNESYIKYVQQLNQIESLLKVKYQKQHLSEQQQIKDSKLD